MSGTRSASKPAPATEAGAEGSKGQGPRISRLALLLYPFAAGAVAINLFMLGLMWQFIGLPAISPMTALYWSIPLGVPATFLFARWVKGLIDEAEGHKR